MIIQHAKGFKGCFGWRSHKTTSNIEYLTGMQITERQPDVRNETALYNHAVEACRHTHTPTDDCTLELSGDHTHVHTRTHTHTHTHQQMTVH